MGELKDALPYVILRLLTWAAAVTLLLVIVWVEVVISFQIFSYLLPPVWGILF